MLRIAPTTPKDIPESDNTIPEIAEAETPPIMDESSLPVSGIVDPIVAGYKGPEQGPFECEHCQFWQAPNTCQIVSGEINPEGICNMYTASAVQEAPNTNEEAEVIPESLAQ